MKNIEFNSKKMKKQNQEQLVRKLVRHMNDKFMITKDDSTILRFIESYDDFDIDELKVLADVFRLLNDHELTEAYYNENGRLKLGVKIVPREKKMYAKNEVDLVNKIQMYEEKKDLYFFKALSEIVANSSYISINDRLVLSNLFEDVSLGQGIGEVKDVGGQMILPIRCNKQKVKTK